jgi:hypothetical protein
MDHIRDVRHPVKAAWLRRQLPYAMQLSCVLFGPLIALGLLAFVFSVVSPYDDDVQPNQSPFRLTAVSYSMLRAIGAPR